MCCLGTPDCSIAQQPPEIIQVALCSCPHLAVPEEGGVLYVLVALAGLRSECLQGSKAHVAVQFALPEAQLGMCSPLAMAAKGMQ